MWKLLILIYVIQSIWCSPFELAQKYIEDFQKGIESLIRESQETQYVEPSLGDVQLNEEEALKYAEKFDFIVVGGGSSGAVIASRLSEIPEFKVLLLEAGKPETTYTLVPGMAGFLWTSTYNWGYNAEPQETICLGMINNTCKTTSGKALGGSSAINSMMYTRGNKKDYDLWADLGNYGWCYEDVLPYFKKQEDAHLQKFDRKYHNQGGPLSVENPQYIPPLTDVILKAGKELGFKEVDYNGKNQIGISVPQITTERGKRESSSQTYLVPNKNRENLVVRPLSQVIQIIINPHTKEAEGVKYLNGGKLYVAKADKEVILSAGTFNSPKLLMLSGIGPKNELQRLKIDVLKDLPVGQNLKDHVYFPGVSFYLNKSIETPNLQDNIIEYLKNRKGPLTSPVPRVLNFVKTEASKDNTNYPDIELFMFTNTINERYENLKSLNYKRNIYDSIWKPIEGIESITIGVVLLHPKSLGMVRLKSKDPLNWPEVHMNQLSDVDDHDLITLLHGIKKAVDFGKTKAFQNIGARINENRVTGCETLEFGSDPYWKCALRYLSTVFYHYVGTCKMGPHTDKEAVVDNRLKVYGVKGLRVADASVIPVTISGHTNAACMMIGEKAADLIKEEWYHKTY